MSQFLCNLVIRKVRCLYLKQHQDGLGLFDIEFCRLFLNKRLFKLHTVYLNKASPDYCFVAAEGLAYLCDP